MRRQEGDADKALAHYTRSLELAEKLLADFPGTAASQRDVSVTLQKLGDFLATRSQPGDADKALAHYIRSLELAQKLLAASPDSAQAARDVSVSMDRLGDFLTRRGQPGDAEAALKHFTRENELLEKLLTASPDSAQAARDVSVSMEKLGDLLAQRGQPGDAEAALKHYMRSLDMKEKLLAANPGSAQAARDVSVCLDSLGDFLAKRAHPGDADKALAHYTRCNELLEKLLTHNPASAEARRDVSVNLNKLGDFLARRAQPGDADKALGHYIRSLDMKEKLLADNPGSAEAVRDVVMSHRSMAIFVAKCGDENAANRHLHAMLDLLKPCIERGMTFDPPTMQLYEFLRAEFAK